MNNESLISLFRTLKDKRGCTLKFIAAETGIEYQRILAIFSLEDRNTILSASEFLALLKLFNDDETVQNLLKTSA